MAEDKKPKIDLKSRLQKMGGPGAPTPPPPAAGIPGVPAPSPSAPPPAVRSVVPGAPISVPPPSGMPRPPSSVRPVQIDANNPLAAAAGLRPPTAAAPAAHAAVAQRIEVDELAVQQARSGARKQGFIGGAVLAVAAAFVAYIAGGAHQQSTDRAKSTADAHELAADLTKAKGQLDGLKDALTKGGSTILGDHKYPTGLGQQLSALVVDFSGDKLFGRRFSGVPADAVRDLMDFITRIQALNNKKDLVVALLNSPKLTKAITDDLASAAAGQGTPITTVVIVDKDTPGGAGRLSLLVTPIKPGDQIPKQLTFINPLGSGNVQLPPLGDPKIPPTGAVIPIVPTSFDKVCPSPAKGAETQLLSSMNSLIDDINGQKGSDTGDYVTDAKPGLSDTAAKLADTLNKVN